jgi:hypothetical protein
MGDLFSSAITGVLSAAIRATMEIFKVDFIWAILLLTGELYGEGRRAHRADWLECRTEQDLLDIHVVGFVDRAGDGVGDDGDLADDILRAFLDVFLADMLEKLRAHRAR